MLLLFNLLGTDDAGSRVTAQLLWCVEEGTARKGSWRLALTKCICIALLRAVRRPSIALAWHCACTALPSLSILDDEDLISEGNVPSQGAANHAVATIATAYACRRSKYNFRGASHCSDSAATRTNTMQWLAKSCAVGVYRGAFALA